MSLGIDDPAGDEVRFLSRLRRWWFPLAVVALLAVSAYNVAQSRHAITATSHAFLAHSPVTDADRWQRWADKNENFFAPLQPGARLAILPDIHARTGLLLTRTASGVTVERRFWLSLAAIPAALEVRASAADAWLQLDLRSGNAFWDSWNALVAGPGVQLYLPLGPDGVRGLGYPEFLQAFTMTAKQGTDF
ncbi:MAG: hypothetical protein ACE5HV_12765 [Acidobacteriota bacterium]